MVEGRFNKESVGRLNMRKRRGYIQWDSQVFFGNGVE